MSTPRQAGLTLVELMVVVTVIGILATIAVFTFNKQSRQAKASEVPAVFAEFKVRQEQFHLENNEYLTTGSTDDDLFPMIDPTSEAVAVTMSTSAVPPPPLGTKYPAPSWQSLRMTLDKSALYCGYVAVAGAASDPSTAGTIATGTFGFNGSLPVPATNWYYLIAKCDFDSDDVDAVYFTMSGIEGMMKENAGE